MIWTFHAFSLKHRKTRTRLRQGPTKAFETEVFNYPKVFITRLDAIAFAPCRLPLKQPPILLARGIGGSKDAPGASFHRHGKAQPGSTARRMPCCGREIR